MWNSQLFRKDWNQCCPEGYIQDGIVLEELSAFDIHFLPGFLQSRQRRASLKINSDLFINHMIFCINVMLMSRQVYVVITSDYTIMVSREIESHHKWLRPLLYWGGLTLHTGHTLAQCRRIRAWEYFWGSKATKQIFSYHGWTVCTGHIPKERLNRPDRSIRSQTCIGMEWKTPKMVVKGL